MQFFSESVPLIDFDMEKKVIMDSELICQIRSQLLNTSSLLILFRGYLSESDSTKHNFGEEILERILKMLLIFFNQFFSLKGKLSYNSPIKKALTLDSSNEQCHFSKVNFHIMVIFFF